MRFVIKHTMLLNIQKYVKVIKKFVLKMSFQRLITFFK